MVRVEDSENSLFEIDSDVKADPNSPMALDLSCKPSTSVVVNVPTFIPTSLISSIEMNKQQSLQNPNINNSSLMLNCHVGTSTGKCFEKHKLLRGKKEQICNDDQINHSEINNVLINSEINNDQINNGQIRYNQINNLVNVGQMQHGQLKNSWINSNHVNTNQANPEVTNNGQFNSNSNNRLLVTEQSILNNHSVPMTNTINPPFLPVNGMPMPSNPFSLPLLPRIPFSEMHKSTQILGSIRTSTRPFKAYPRDPLVLSISNKATSSAYNKFRKVILEQVKHTENEGTNSKMRRTSNRSGSPTSSTTDKDRAYIERRKKNNAAAKRSRDNRRAKEDEIAVRASFLEEQNIKLWHGLYIIAKIAKEQNVQINHNEIEGNDCLSDILSILDNLETQ